MSFETEIFHAWFSQKQAQINGTITYRSLNDQNRLVIATFVSKTEKHGCEWDDIQYLGLVKGWCGSNKSYTKKIW